MRKLVAIVGIVLAMCSVAPADLIKRPGKESPKQGSDTGTLAWSSEAKDQVCLKTPGGGVLSLGMVSNLPKTVVCDKLIDKRVVVKFMLQRNTSGAMVVSRVLDIKEAPPQSDPPGSRASTRPH